MTDNGQLTKVLNTLQQHVGSNLGSPSDTESELARVNREMYERNLELAVRNQTLSLLRKMYEIMNTSLELKETSQKLIESIVSELKFQSGAILLVDRTENILKTAAFFQRQYDKMQTIPPQVITYIETLGLPLQQKENFAVNCCLEKRTRLTNSLYDILAPKVDEKKAEELQKAFGMATIVLYPISFAGETFGVLMVNLDKHVGDLSRMEREALHELIEVVAIAIDRVKIYADLKTANEKLKALDKLKDEFVSIASHELRTPMTAIKSYLWMALAGKGGVLSDKQKFYLDRAYNSTDRLIKLVNDMLNISRIESGRMTYDMQKVNIIQLSQEVVDEIKPRADELGIAIQIDTAQVSAVLADPDKIKEVFFNLVGNSLKFTPKGGAITLSFTEKNGLVVCSVTDTGAGISKEDMEKLFQKFGLMAGSYTINKTDVQGTGLGLYITKSIIETHKGTINATSDGVGKGATFTFTLPIYNEKSHEEFNKTQEGKEKIGIIHTAVV